MAPQAKFLRSLLDGVACGVNNFKEIYVMMGINVIFQFSRPFDKHKIIQFPLFIGKSAG